MFFFLNKFYQVIKFNENNLLCKGDTYYSLENPGTFPYIWSPNRILLYVFKTVKIRNKGKNDFFSQNTSTKHGIYINKTNRENK